MTDVKTIVIASLFTFSGILGLIGALKGRSRGIKRQTVRTITVLLSAVISFVLVKALYGAVMGFLDTATMDEIFLKLEGYNVYVGAEIKGAASQLDPLVLRYLLALPLALFVGPISFVPIFVSVSGVMWIVHVILSGILGFRKKKNNKLTRFFGMLLGLVQGVAVSVILLSPVLGIASTLSTTVESVRQKETLNDTEKNLISFYDTNVKDAIECGPVKVFTDFGGRFIYSSLTNIKLDGVSVDMTAELGVATSVYKEITSISTADITALGAEDQARIKGIVDTVLGSNYYAPVFTSLFNSSGTIIEDKLVTSAEEPIKGLLTELIGVFGSSTRETIKEDFNTLCDFLFLLTNEGVFSASDAPDSSGVAELLLKPDASGKTTVDKAVAILDSNPRTRAMVESLVKFAVVYAKETLMENFEMAGLDAAEIDKIYEDVKGGVGEIVKINPESYASAEEYKGAVAESVEQMAIDNGFISEAELNENREKADKVFSEVSEHIADNFAGKEEISDAELVNIITRYYNSYVENENKTTE